MELEWIIFTSIIKLLLRINSFIINPQDLCHIEGQKWKNCLRNMFHLNLLNINIIIIIITYYYPWQQ